MKQEKNKVQNNKNHKLGFTLLELLVVVLIIGILAAIALPYYDMAVEKGKASQVLTFIGSLYESAQVYQLDTGNWPSDIEYLDIEIPEEFKGSGEWLVWADGNGIGVNRIKGKYTGTGFVKYNKHNYSIIPKGPNLCVEIKKGGNYTFDGKQGSYCNKIFHGKAVYIGESNWTNIWLLQ